MHNFFSSPVNTTRTLLARHVLSRSGVNRAIHFAHEAEGKKESESDDQGTRTFVRIMEEKENGKRERRQEDRPLQSKAGPRARREQEGEEGRKELRGRLVVKMKAPPLVAAPFVREDGVTVQLTPVYTAEEA